MLAADSEESDWLIDIIATGDAMFRHDALCFAAITSHHFVELFLQLGQCNLTVELSVKHD